MMRTFINLLSAAYIGGVIATYAAILRTMGALGPTLSIYPLYFAIFALIFTLPGAFWVAKIYGWSRRSFSLPWSYIFAIVSGIATSSCIFWIFDTSSVQSIIEGASFGFFVSVTWAGVNRYILPAF